MQQLETIVNVCLPSSERQFSYQTQDLGYLSSVQLYSGPISGIGSGPLFGSGQFGCFCPFWHETCGDAVKNKPKTPSFGRKPDIFD